MTTKLANVDTSLLLVTELVHRCCKCSHLTQQTVSRSIAILPNGAVFHFFLEGPLVPRTDSNPNEAAQLQTSSLPGPRPAFTPESDGPPGTVSRPTPGTRVPTIGETIGEPRAPTERSRRQQGSWTSVTSFIVSSTDSPHFNNSTLGGAGCGEDLGKGTAESTLGRRRSSLGSRFLTPATCKPVGAQLLQVRAFGC